VTTSTIPGGDPTPSTVPDPSGTGSCLTSSALAQSNEPSSGTPVDSIPGADNVTYKTTSTNGASLAFTGTSSDMFWILYVGSLLFLLGMAGRKLSTRLTRNS
jgi:hypothetical protein